MPDRHSHPLALHLPPAPPPTGPLHPPRSPCLQEAQHRGRAAPLLCTHLSPVRNTASCGAKLAHLGDFSPRGLELALPLFRLSFNYRPRELAKSRPRITRGPCGHRPPGRSPDSALRQARTGLCRGPLQFCCGSGARELARLLSFMSLEACNLKCCMWQT